MTDKEIIKEIKKDFLEKKINLKFSIYKDDGNWLKLFNFSKMFLEYEKYKKDFSEDELKIIKFLNDKKTTIQNGNTWTIPFTIFGIKNFLNDEDEFEKLDKYFLFATSLTEEKIIKNGIEFYSNFAHFFNYKERLSKTKINELNEKLELIKKNKKTDFIVMPKGSINISGINKDEIILPKIRFFNSLKNIYLKLSIYNEKEILKDSKLFIKEKLNNNSIYNKMLIKNLTLEKNLKILNNDLEKKEIISILFLLK